LSSAFWPASSTHSMLLPLRFFTRKESKSSESLQKIKSKKHDHAFLSSRFPPFKLPASNTTTSSHFSVVFLFSYWSWVSLSRGTPCTISSQKSISDSIYPSENK
jgi:hypothetical protein